MYSVYYYLYCTSLHPFLSYYTYFFLVTVLHSMRIDFTTVVF